MDAAVAICIERWRNANPEERKRTWGVFDERGLFLAACRHGIIVSICDMVKSGELYVIIPLSWAPVLTCYLAPSTLLQPLVGYSMHMGPTQSSHSTWGAPSI